MRVLSLLLDKLAATSEGPYNFKAPNTTRFLFDKGSGEGGVSGGLGVVLTEYVLGHRTVLVLPVLLVLLVLLVLPALILQ